MEEFLNEEQLRQVLGSAKERRMEQLELELATRKEYLEAIATKRELMNQMESLIQERGRGILWRYDDAWALLNTRAQDYFYDRGFMDCFHLFRLMQGRNRKGKC